MAKRAATFELALPPRHKTAPAYRWLYASLRAAILEGRLRAAARLPATRDLARQYRLSRGTIVSAVEQLQSGGAPWRPAARLPPTRDPPRQYRLSRGTIVSAVEQLKSEGYVEARTGSGTYVSNTLPDDLLQVRSTPKPPLAQEEMKPRKISAYAKRVRLFPSFALRPSRAFRPNLPALDLFPTTLWAQVAARRLRKVSTNFLLGCDPLGYLPLRHAVADYLSSSRGVNCVPGQIAIVSGAQEALDRKSVV